MKSKTRILLLTGFLLAAAGTWLLVTQGKTPGKDPANVARTDTGVGSSPKAGTDARHREASGAVPKVKRLEERLWTADDLERYLTVHGRARESLRFLPQAIRN